VEKWSVCEDLRILSDTKKIKTPDTPKFVFWKWKSANERMIKWLSFSIASNLPTQKKKRTISHLKVWKQRFANSYFFLGSFAWFFFWLVCFVPFCFTFPCSVVRNRRLR
jgi:hypothetical protein